MKYFWHNEWQYPASVLTTRMHSQLNASANTDAGHVLLAVDDGLNQTRGAQGSDQWMPPNRAF